LRRDAEANRRRVLQAASEVFAARGLDASVEEIAQRAGVGMGTLYRRFPNKEALIEELVHQLFDQVLTSGREALESTDGTGLEAFLRRTAALQEAQRGCMPRMWQSPLPERFLGEMDHIVATLLARAQAAGQVRPDCTAGDVTVAFWAVRGIIESAGDIAPGAWERHLDLLIAGLRPDGRALPHVPLTDGQRAASRDRAAGR
jgi:AcrR family transcriptional regulator